MNTTPSAEREIALSAGRFILFLTLGCVLFELALVAGDAIVNFGRLTDLVMIRVFFNIAREDSLASWFSSLQLWMAGLSLGLIFLTVRSLPDMRWRRWGWLVLALFFCYMAFDDGTQFHERIASALDALHARNHPVDGAPIAYPGYTWQWVFGPFFGLMGLFLLFFLYYEFRLRLSLLLFLAGLGLYVFAVGLDFVEGLGRNHPLNLYRALADQTRIPFKTVSHFAKSLEEFSEMLGTTFFLAAFLNHGLRQIDGVRWRLS